MPCGPLNQSIGPFRESWASTMPNEPSDRPSRLESTRRPARPRQLLRKVAGRIGEYAGSDVTLQQALANLQAMERELEQHGYQFGQAKQAYFTAQTQGAEFRAEAVPTQRLPSGRVWRDQTQRHRIELGGSLAAWTRGNRKSMHS